MSKYYKSFSSNMRHERENYIIYTPKLSQLTISNSFISNISGNLKNWNQAFFLEIDWYPQSHKLTNLIKVWFDVQ